jgi:hypothetical protein
LSLDHLIRPDGNILLSDGRRAMCWRLRVLAARARVPRPDVYRFYSHYAWHVCLHEQRPEPCRPDTAHYIEVTWP